jgi:hypothetical protein
MNVLNAELVCLSGKPVHVRDKSNQEMEMNAIKKAIKFHELYEKYAPEYGYETKETTKIFDASSPNGKLMIRVCREIEAENDMEIGTLTKGLRNVLYQGHNDDCLFCGFKDKIAMQTLNQEPGGGK